MGQEVGGRFKREGHTHIYGQFDIWQKPTQYYKAIILQLKIIFLKKKTAGFSRSFCFPSVVLGCFVMVV